MRRAIALAALLLCACTYDYDTLRRGRPIDAGPPGPDAGPRCAGDDECDDGTWCNGDEHCRPSDQAADDFGCVPGIPRCVVTGECLETDQSCGSGCADDDGDGYEATQCGGNDCDDTDPRRNPGGSEQCDVAGLDEDCNPATFGVLDADGDSFPDDSCCNGDFCGNDCNDNNDAQNPTIVEVCDHIDNNCDGRVDEGVQTTFYRDVDGDGFGASAPTTADCSRPSGYSDNASDCDDNRAATNPAATEACNMIDDNCDRAVDNACM
jgi:hypothetical protein